MEILFVCTGNTCRSPMAEAILKYLSKKNNLDLNAKSAGIFARENGPIAINSIEVMRDFDIDISNYTSNSIDNLDFNDIDIILTMGKSHKEILIDRYPYLRKKIFLLNDYAFGIEEDIRDPFGGDLREYKSVLDEIYKAILAIIRSENGENRNR